jgi:predicted peroxiredoxin
MAQEARELICMITRGTDHELAVDLVRKRAADTTQVNPLEPLVKLINDFMTRGGTIWACTPCVKSGGYSEADSWTELSSQERA